MADSAFIKACRESLGMKEPKIRLEDRIGLFLKRKAAEEAARSPQQKKKTKMILVLTPRPWFSRLVINSHRKWKAIKRVAKDSTLDPPVPEKPVTNIIVSEQSMETVTERNVEPASAFKEGYVSQHIDTTDWRAPTSFKSVIIEPPTMVVSDTKPFGRTKAAEFLQADFQFFLRKFESIPSDKALIFNPKWIVGSGFDDIAEDLGIAFKLIAGTQFKSIAPDGRRLIITGTYYGPVVVHQISTDAEGGSPIGYFGPKEFRQFNIVRNKTSLLSSSDMEWIIGCDSLDSTDNIGKLSMRIANQNTRY